MSHVSSKVSCLVTKHKEYKGLALQFTTSIPNVSITVDKM